MLKFDFGGTDNKAPDRVKALMIEGLFEFQDEKLKSTQYFPWTELTIFIVTMTLTFAIVNNLDLSIWLLILVTVAGYFIFLGRTNYITVTEDKIEIIFFNLIGVRVSVNLNKNLKVLAAIGSDKVVAKTKHVRH